jgi:hypothetical protein
MAVIAQIGSGDVAYEIIFYLHILSAIIGLGTVFLNGLYGQQALNRRGAEGAAIGQVNLAVSNVAEIFIYAVFVTGLLMGIMADDGTGIELSDSWLSVSMLLFIIAIGLSHGLLRPTVKKLNAAMAATTATAETDTAPAGPEGSSTGVKEMDIDALAKRAATTGAALNLITIVILYLMVWKPGSGLG